MWHWALPRTSVEETYLLCLGPTIWDGGEMFAKLIWSEGKVVVTYCFCTLGIKKVDMVPHA